MKTVKYDFNWIEDTVKQWKKSGFIKNDKKLLKKSLNFLPLRISLYEGAIWTHLDEDIYDYNDYLNQRNKFYDYLIEKYT